MLRMLNKLWCHLMARPVEDTLTLVAPTLLMDPVAKPVGLDLAALTRAVNAAVAEKANAIRPTKPTNFMLSARIASASSLNVPKARAVAKPRATSATKPLRKIEAAAPKKVAPARHVSLALRSLPPVRTAQIIRFVPGESRSGVRTAKVRKAA